MTAFPSPIRVPPEARHGDPFEGFLCPHPKLVVAARDVARIACNPTGEDVILIVGPHDVGMRSLSAYIEHILVSSFQDRGEADPFARPCVTFRLMTNPSRGFTWESFYRRALDTVGLGIDMRRHVAPWRVAESGGDRAQTAYQQMLSAVGAKLVLVHGATDFFSASSDWMVFRHWDHFGKLAHLTGVPHAILGDYRLLGLWGFNAEHNARTKVVHFARYAEADGQEFVKTVNRFAKRLSGFLPFEADTSMNLIKERSIGRIGTVRNWLHEAFVHASDAKKHQIGPDSITQSAPQIGRSLEEMMAGEACVAAIQSGSTNPPFALLGPSHAPQTLPRHRQLSVSLLALLEPKSKGQLHA